MISDGGPEVGILLKITTAATWKLYVAPRSREVTRAEVTLAPTDKVLAVCVCVCVGGGGGGGGGCRMCIVGLTNKASYG